MTTYTRARLTVETTNALGDGITDEGHVDVPTTTQCPDCNGDGNVWIVPGSEFDSCSTCDGSGTVPTRWATVAIGDVVEIIADEPGYVSGGWIVTGIDAAVISLDDRLDPVCYWETPPDNLQLDITTTLAALEEANDPATVWRRHDLTQATKETT